MKVIKKASQYLSDESLTIEQPRPPPNATLSSLVQNPSIEQEQSVGEENDHYISDEHLAPIDAFLESISKPLPQPLLTQRPC
jgi:hypothetical protein